MYDDHIFLSTLPKVGSVDSPFSFEASKFSNAWEVVHGSGQSEQQQQQ